MARTPAGTIRAIDLKTQTITVQASAVTLTFGVPTDTEIVVKDKPRVQLSDLVVGDNVEVKYTDDETGHVAHSITILGLKSP